MFTISKQNMSVSEFLLMCEKRQVCPALKKDEKDWDLEKKQEVIAAVLRNTDLPKIYLSWVPEDPGEDDGCLYSVVKGRRKLLAILEFREGKFPLPDGLDLMPGEEAVIGGMYYDELAEKYPRLAGRFLSFRLDFVKILTDERDSVRTVRETAERLEE